MLVCSRPHHKGDVSSMTEQAVEPIETIRTIIKQHKEEEMSPANDQDKRFIPATASEVIYRLDEREQNIEDFVLMHGLGSMVNLFNELGDEICRPDGRFAKGVDEVLMKWYVSAAKSIKYHYAVGMSKQQINC